MSGTAIDAQVDSIASVGDECEVCCRHGAFAVGRINGTRLVNGFRHSAAVCDDCLPIVLTGDWPALERLVFQYQASDWSLWGAIVRRRRARKVARRIALLNASLFRDIPAAPTERSAS